MQSSGIERNQFILAISRDTGPDEFTSIDVSKILLDGAPVRLHSEVEIENQTRVRTRMRVRMRWMSIQRNVAILLAAFTKWTLASAGDYSRFRYYNVT